MAQFNPELQLETAFILDDKRRITSTREPDPDAGPLFYLIRGPEHCAWAIHADLSEELAAELDCLARDEPPITDLRYPPKHCERYTSLIGGRVYYGPAFTFPEVLPESTDVVVVNDGLLLEKHFPRFTEEQIAGRSPVLAIVKDGSAVSICYCARRSVSAAEAGVDTIDSFRGYGFASRVTAAWASAIRANGRMPIYSTSWDNEASLAVARKLNLIACASDWSLSG